MITHLFIFMCYQTRLSTVLYNMSYELSMAQHRTVEKNLPSANSECWKLRGEGYQASQEEILHKRGWVSEKSRKKSPKLEKIWWVGVFLAVLEKIIIPSKIFSLTPPVRIRIYRGMFLYYFGVRSTTVREELSESRKPDST